MKIALVVLLFGLNALAVDAVSTNGGVLGIDPGVYKGSGVLASQTFGVVDFDFTTTRTLGGGEIHASSTASFWSVPLATASADFRVVPRAGGVFDLVGLNAGDSGHGVCNAVACRFTAHAMSGALTLTETWTRTARGFTIDGSQDFHGAVATYSTEADLD